MPTSNAPNNWMKALRNLIKFNEATLHEINDQEAEEMFTMCLTKLASAYPNRPIIAFNTLEAFFFLLKYRQRNWTFIPRGSKLHDQAKNLAIRIQDNSDKPKTRTLARMFIEYLDWEGNDDGMGSIFEGDD
jgi:hypothetical protein